MSVIKTVPKSSRFLQVDATFQAQFNVPSLGQYNFEQIAGAGFDNSNIVLFEPMADAAIYLIDRFSFSAQINEGTYLEAVATVPTAQLKTRISRNVPIYQRPIPCINYVDNAEALAYFYTSQSSQQQATKDALLVDFRGLMNQPAALVGTPILYAHLSFTIYEIIDMNWIKIFRDTTEFMQKQQVIQ